MSDETHGVDLLETDLPENSFDLNPYATPATVSDAPLVDEVPVQTPWLRRVIVLQAIVILASLAVEAYQHESIVGSGPIFALVGLVIAVLAFRNRDRAAMVFGVSAIAFALLVVFLINYNSWGPPQGNRPITLLAFTYAAFALPISFWLAFARSKLAGSHRTVTHQAT